MTIESMYTPIGGPKPIGIEDEIWKWAQTFAQHKAFCHEYFGGRADLVIEQARLLQEESAVGPTACLDLCMQIEAEFPGRIEEFIGRSEEHPQGRIIGLMQYIVHVRKYG